MLHISCARGKQNLELADFILERADFDGVREFANKSAASAASPDYVNFQAVIKSAASAASPRGGRASGRLDHDFLFAMFGRASGQNIYKHCKHRGLCYIYSGHCSSQPRKKAAVVAAAASRNRKQPQEQPLQIFIFFTAASRCWLL